MIKKSKTFFHNRITIPRITILGMFLALLITAKYALGFVPGVEIVSFLFIIFALLLPFTDAMLLVASFNFLVVVLYGFGSWWFVYWIIWPADVIGARILKRFTTNRYAFGVFGFLAGASVGFWYFLSDLIVFGQAYALANVITAIPINLIEGFTTMLMIVLLGNKILHVSTFYSPTIWGYEGYEFRPSKNVKLGIGVSTTISLVSLGSILTFFNYNQFFIEWKQRYVKADPELYTPPGHLVPGEPSSLGPSGWGLMNIQQYNNLYDQINPETEIALAIIAYDNIWTDIVSWDDGDTVVDIIGKSRFTINYHYTEEWGAWMKTFKVDGEHDTWQKGKSNSTNYGDYYPMYTINHKYANFGVSNWTSSPGEIYEITYDHNS